MNKEQIYSAWVPDDSLWSRWAKPVLFAHLDSSVSETPSTEGMPDVTWAPATDETAAIILDLPGELGVSAGAALAAKGYRPVPLYNSVPLPSGEPLLDPDSGKRVAAVNVLPIIAALRRNAERLSRMNLSFDAPPAFLLDSNRHGDGRTMQPDEFDNRSICFTTDFPSANFLNAHGIRRALLVQKASLQPPPDLAHTLRRWQEGGLVLERIQIDSPGRPEVFQVSKPSWYGAMFQRALSAIGLRRANAGGFGAWVPDSSSGG
jgi:hypothetical protein